MQLTPSFVAVWRSESLVSLVYRVNAWRTSSVLIAEFEAIGTSGERKTEFASGRGVMSSGKSERDRPGFAGMMNGTISAR